MVIPQCLTKRPSYFIKKKKVLYVHFHKIGINMVVTVVHLNSKELLDDQKNMVLL